METITSWSKNIIIFLLMSTLLSNISAGKKYKQYIKMFTGMILIILVLSPIINILDSDMSFIDRFKRYNKISELKEDTVLNTNGEDYRNSYILSEYEQHINENITEILSEYKYSVIALDIDIEEEGDYFGRLNSINLELISNDNITGSKNDIIVEQIKVQNNGQKKEAYSHSTITDKTSENIKKLKNVLGNFYNVNINNINIIIREGKDGE